MKTTIITATILCACLSGFAQAPRPLPGNPGNIFVQGEDVVLQLGANSAQEWQATDYEGQSVASGKSDGGRADLGRLPVGYYTLRAAGSAPVSLAVIAPLKVPTPSDSPIDVNLPSPSWLANPEMLQQYASIAALAGMNWGRSAIVWSKIEPEQNELDASDSFGSFFQATRASGLHLLTYVQEGPQWTGAEERRFPPDLREVFAFYRDLASRWKQYIGAVEPWNEPNSRNTGAEIATYQKAAYLGLKAGNPSIRVCSSALMRSSTPPVVQSLEENDFSAYFDELDFHHYAPYDTLPDIYQTFRPLAAGKPIWVTEFNDPIVIEPDSSQDDPSADNMELQMERLPKMYAATLYQGAQQAFYFTLKNRIESGRNYRLPDSQIQFGVLHEDLTPRPAYLALTAVGRLLAGAHVIGKPEFPRPDEAYAFSAVPDGVPSDVIVAWSNRGSSDLHLPTPMTAAYDVMGRRLKPASLQEINVTASPVFIVLPAGTVRNWAQRPGSSISVTPPPSPAPQAASNGPSPVVIQAAFTGQQLLMGPWNHNLSADVTEAHHPVQIYVYNFSDRELTVSLKAEVPRGWTSHFSEDTLTIPPGDRAPVSLNLSHGLELAGAPATIFIKATGPGVGNSVLAFNLMTGG